MCIRKIAWSSHSCRPVDQPKSSRLLLVPWCTTIAGYHTSRKTSYNQWLATDKQEICYQARVSQGEGKPPQTKHTHDKSSMLMLAILIVLCMSNDFICAYITVIHDKEFSRHAPCDICCKQSEFFDYYLVYYPPIIYNLW